jgi:amidase/aspartyl-tRNA(Asn)/glutamyl-tRNA(Gln) amidotransferase subunit A
MTASAEIATLTAADIARRIRRRELSPVEIVDAAIKRIETRNPSLNAFVYLAFDEARDSARKAEQKQMRGAAIGPLFGVPTAMKDLFDCKPGWITTFGGVRAFKNYRADSYTTYPERIERAGAIVLGKTNSPVMGFRGVCDNYLFGPTRNPFDLRRNSGGSSGGSAAAVADGLVAVAGGTDGGGSIRIPSSWCGVFGFKPSFGRVPFPSRPDRFAATTPFLFEGPIARTVEDAALAMTALTGYHPSDPFSLDERVDFMAATQRSIAGMRIAFSPDFGIFPVESDVRETIVAAVQVFEELGAHVEPVDISLPYSQQELADLWCRLVMPLSVGAFEDFKAQGIDLLRDHRADFPPAFLTWLERGYRYTLPDLRRDQIMRTSVYDALLRATAPYDLLVTPTLACLPVENSNDGDSVGPSSINGQSVNPLIGWCMTYLQNFTGNPAASIPAGLARGLPVGMQIIGRRYADADVFAASAGFERARPWHPLYDLCEQRSRVIPS